MNTEIKTQWVSDARGNKCIHFFGNADELRAGWERVTDKSASKQEPT